MKNLAKFYATFKFDDPRVFAIVTLVANILNFILEYLGTYGNDANKPLILFLSTVLTYVLTNLGVRTTRWLIDSKPENTIPNDSNTEQ